MIYTVKVESDVRGHQLTINNSGIKRAFMNEVAVAKELGIDAGELFEKIARHKGMVFVIKREGEHWYA